jgi:hypothetical protein
MNLERHTGLFIPLRMETAESFVEVELRAGNARLNRILL